MQTSGLVPLFPVLTAHITCPLDILFARPVVARSSSKPLRAPRRGASRRPLPQRPKSPDPL
eukprot:4773076-Heterocapsa_arctica.AAC.1